MIRVAPAEAPADFEERVRRPGLEAIAELVGEKPSTKRPGPRRMKIAGSRDDIPPDAFPPHWRKVLPDMLAAYHRLCAYLSLYIEHATGSASVDHVVPKSRAWNRVYEWSNFRLASAGVNARKGVADLVLDPFEITDDLFALEFVDFQVKPGPGATGPLTERVVDTIEKLGLNSQDCCLARREYVECYERRQIDAAHLERRAPFIARELARQGLLRR